MNKENKIPIAYHVLYLLLSTVICYLYYKKIVERVDFNAPNSINAVSGFATAKPYQFRLLIPVLFTLFKPLYFLGEKTVYVAYDIIIIYLLILSYKKLLGEYIENKKAILLLAPVILYPVLWNYVILNESFQYYDFTAILIFTVGMYYIIKEKFSTFLFIFIIGLINKETIVYLIFVYALFNYKNLFTKKIILNAGLLATIFLGYKLLLNYMFSANPGDTYEVGYLYNIQLFKDLPHNRIIQKNLAFNFGCLYLFTILLFITGRWKKFPDKKKVFLNLAFIPYVLLGVYITYFTEVRVYAELIPMITSLFIIYLTTISKLKLLPKLQKH